VSAPRYGTPARVVQGLDPRRVSLLVAVLEKSAGLQLGGSDLFVSVAGGLRLDDPASDAALLAALASGHTGRPLPDATLFLGEVGLRGNLRSGSHLSERCAEARRLGFERVVAPPPPAGVKDIPAGLLVEVDSVQRLLNLCRIDERVQRPRERGMARGGEG
jgi:DNA repair protein RadA/Sms